MGRRVDMSRRLEILRRATEVFERQGVTNTSIEDIAEAVGIKREAIYYYFGSRAEILVKILLPQGQAMCLNLESILNSNMSAAEKLRAAITHHLHQFTPNYLEMSVALREDHFRNEDSNVAKLRRAWREYGDLWTRLIAEGQQSGEFRGGLDPKMISYGILGMCNWLSRWYDPAKPVSIDEIITIFYSFSAEGILARPVADTNKSGA